MKVYLNMEDKGDHFFSLTTEGDVLFPRADLEEMGIRRLPPGEEEYLSLLSLSPQFKFNVDRKKSTLYIFGEPGLFEKQVVDLSYQSPHELFNLRDTTAFMNYGLISDLGDDFDFSTFILPIETGVSLRRSLLLSNFTYTRSREEGNFTRLMSSFTADDPESLRRFVFGDFSASSGVLGGGGAFGGISISTRFSLQPHFLTYPVLNYSGVIETPSEMKLYVNDLLVETLRLPPGEFELLNIPNAIRKGDAVFVIKDAYGREKRFTRPFYISSSLLKPGLHEYSYNFGFRREAFGQESFEYDDPAFVGFHRVGVTRKVTAGIRAEADKDTVSFGPTTTFLLGRLGEVNASFAVSSQNEEFGYGGFLSYLFSGLKSINGSFSLTGLSSRYSNISLISSRDRALFTGRASLGYNFGRLGSISALYIISDNRDGIDTTSASISYRKSLFKGISMSLTATRREEEEEIGEIFVNLHFPLGKSRTGSLSYSASEDRTRETASFQQNPSRGSGWGYRLQAKRSETFKGEGEEGGNAFLQYQGRHGIYSADYRRAAGGNSYGFNMSGGLAFLNKSFYFSRPLSDSFALVKVGGIEGVDVYNSNQKIGETNRRGEVLVPDLISYYDNNLSIEDKDIPINYTIGETRRFVFPPFRGGGVVEFDLLKLQAFTGRLFFMKRGEKIPAQYAGLEIAVEDRPLEFIVGKGGKFYLENLVPGSFPARLYLKEKECKFKMVIPESNKVHVDLGEVICEMD